MLNKYLFITPYHISLRRVFNDPNKPFILLQFQWIQFTNVIHLVNWQYNLSDYHVTNESSRKAILWDRYRVLYRVMQRYYNYNNKGLWTLKNPENEVTSGGFLNSSNNFGPRYDKIYIYFSTIIEAKVDSQNELYERGWILSYIHCKDYYITGRANPISCAVGLC